MLSPALDHGNCYVLITCSLACYEQKMIIGNTNKANKEILSLDDFLNPLYNFGKEFVVSYALKQFHVEMSTLHVFTVLILSVVLPAPLRMLWKYIFLTIFKNEMFVFF